MNNYLNLVLIAITIVLGYLLKIRKILNSNDAITLSKISVNLTLPMAIIAGFRHFFYDSSLLIVGLFGFFISFIMIFVAGLITRKRDKITRVTYMMNSSSFNIGSFALPLFMSGSLQPLLRYLLVFDAGNALYCTGLNSVVGDIFLNRDRRISAQEVLIKLLKSPPFMTYICMLSLYFLGVKLPDVVFDISAIFGQTNMIIVMLMFGITFNPMLIKSKRIEAIKILMSRYLVLIVISSVLLLTYSINRDLSFAMAFCLLTPMTTVTLAFCMRLGCDTETVSFVNSIAIVVSLVLFVILLVLFI